MQIVAAVRQIFGMHPAARCVFSRNGFQRMIHDIDMRPDPFRIKRCHISGNERNIASEIQIMSEVPDHSPEFFRIIRSLFLRIVFPLMPQDGDNLSALLSFAGFLHGIVIGIIVRIPA